MKNKENNIEHKIDSNIVHKHAKALQIIKKYGNVYLRYDGQTDVLWSMYFALEKCMEGIINPKDKKRYHIFSWIDISESWNNKKWQFAENIKDLPFVIFKIPYKITDSHLYKSLKNLIKETSSKTKFIILGTIPLKEMNKPPLEQLLVNFTEIIIDCNVIFP